MIKELIKKSLRAIWSPLYAKKKYHSLFYFLYLEGLKGMDHGYKFKYPDESGEDLVVQIANRYFLNNRISPTIIDVGSNDGAYASMWLEKEITSGKVHCFEPSKFTYKKLEDHLTKYSQDNYTLNNLGLSDKDEAIQLYTDKPGSGMASLVPSMFSPPYDIKKELHEQIECTTLELYCSRQSIEHVDFLKIDVEGYELAVLLGATSFIRDSKISFIQFEFGHLNIDACTPLKKFYELLTENYSMFRIISDGLVPCNDYSYEYEIYLGTNFLCIKHDLVDQIAPLFNK